MFVEAADLSLQMPFPDKHRFVAALLQFLGKPGRGVVDFPIQVFNSVYMAVLAGYKTGSTGGAYGVGTNKVVEAHAISSKRIDGGCCCVIF